jgi:phage-related protein
MAFVVEYFDVRILRAVESWPSDVIADYQRLINLLISYGPDIGMPHSRAIGGGLFELRPRGRSGIGRAFYCFLMGKRVIIVHVFIKKSQDTPEKELKLARKRMKEVFNA